MLYMTNIHYVLGLLAVFPAASLGQDFCSLTVHIAGASLTPQVPVTVEESDGRRETAYSIDGVARFCGLGLSPVTIRVGRDCAPVTVSGVRPVWGGTRNVDVIYNDSQCREDRAMALGGPICSLLLRFRGDDKNGKPLAGVALRPPARKSPVLCLNQSISIVALSRKLSELLSYDPATSGLR
jgi:hypothetical protein